MFNRLLATVGASALCWSFGSLAVANLTSGSRYTLTGMWQGYLVMVIAGWFFLIRLIWRKQP